MAVDKKEISPTLACFRIPAFLMRNCYKFDTNHHLCRKRRRFENRRHRKGDGKSPYSAPANCKFAGGYVQTDSCLTPNGLQFYIPNTGDYIVNFTLPNGDEYYGEFTVTDWQPIDLKHNIIYKTRTNPHPNFLDRTPNGL